MCVYTRQCRSNTYSCRLWSPICLRKIVVGEVLDKALEEKSARLRNRNSPSCFSCCSHSNYSSWNPKEGNCTHILHLLPPGWMSSDSWRIYDRSVKTGDTPCSPFARGTHGTRQKQGLSQSLPLTQQWPARSPSAGRTSSMAAQFGSLA